MTRLEKALSLDTCGCSKMEMITYYCPHDFGVEDDSKRYKSGWGCTAPSGCKGCWNREIEDDSDGN